MLNLIRAEFYKTSKRVYSKVFLLICCALVIAFVVLMRRTIPEDLLSVGRSEMFGVLQYVMSIPFFLTLITSDIVYSEEGKHNTLKNVVSFGYTREQIYVSKLIVSVINFIIMALIVLAVSIVSVIVLFPGGEHWIVSLNVYLWCFLVSLPLWLSQVAVCIAAWSIIKSSTAGTMAALFVGCMLPTALQMLYFLTDYKQYNDIAQLFPFLRLTEVLDIKIYAYTVTETGSTLTEVFDDYKWFADLLLENCLYGFGFFAVAAIAGWLIFRKKEIK